MTRSSTRTTRASRIHRSISTSMSRCSSAPKTIGAWVCSSIRLGLVTLVGVDDVLHDTVPHYVARPELDEDQALDAVEDAAHLRESGTPAAVGQVDLGHVARDNCLRSEAEAREEHLHLFGRGVLGLVEDDEGIVEGAAAHVRERGDFDRSPLHEPR